MIQDKAQPAFNGSSLNKGCNEGLDHLWASLRARRAVIICGVASLEKDMPFSARCAVQLMASRRADICFLSVTPHEFQI